MQAFAMQGSLSQVFSCAMYILAFSGANFAAQCGASAAASVLASLILVIDASRGVREQRRGEFVSLGPREDRPSPTTSVVLSARLPGFVALPEVGDEQ